jgi:fibronectin-binding autotransporter adhesin
LTLEALEDRTLPTVTIWTGLVDSNWSDNANWSNGKPGPGDTAEFNSDSAQTQSSTANTSFSIAGLKITTGLANGSITVNAPLVLTGSSEWDSGSIIVNGSNGGTLTNNGTMTLSEGSLSGEGTFTNNGTISQLGAAAGGLTLSNLSGGGSGITRLNNAVTGIIDLQSDSGIVGHGPDLLSNAGTIEKTGGTSTSTIHLPLANTGTIDSESGTIQLVGVNAGNTTAPNGTTDTNGTFKIAAGAFIDLAQGSSLPFTENGTFTATASGTILLDSGRLTTSPTGATLNVAGTVTFLWSGADIDTTPMTTLTYNGPLSVDASGAPTLDGGGTFVENGTITESGAGYLYLSPGTSTTTTLDISSGSKVDFASDAGIYGGQTTSTESTLLDNAGTIQKTGGTGTSSVGIAMLSNSGTMGVSTGTLVVKVGGGSSTFTNSGSLLIAAGSTLQVPNNYTQTSAGSLHAILAGPGQFGQLQVAGQATIAGALIVGTANNFSPTNGQRFPVLSAGSAGGTFATLNGLSFANGFVLNPVYSSTGVVLLASVSPLLAAAGQDVNATAGQSFSGVVATITDAFSGVTTSSLQATIAWGDGHTSAGTVTANSDGTFSVRGTNTFAQAGSFAVSVTIHDTVNNQSAVAHGTATVQPVGTLAPPALESSTALGFARARRGVTLMASVQGTAGTPSGRVQFFDVFRGQMHLLGTATVSGGVARLRVVLRRGGHALHAVYLGDGSYSGSLSAVRLRRVVS